MLIQPVEQRVAQKIARLNVQGLARKDEGLMSCIVTDLGNEAVSCDLGAGEPTCTAFYSGDRNYYDACFGMVGKAPHYAGPVLKIDDIYLTTMSVSPIGAATIREVVNEKWNGGTFAERWLEDPEFFTKKLLKKERQLHKILALGLSYSMGPRKLVKQAYDAGYSIDYRTAKEFYNAYWRLFARVKAFGDRLEGIYSQKGYLVNDFGYRLVPDQPYKCLNYFIQSTVSGIMHVLCEKFFTLCPWAEFLTVIHDEVIIEVPEGRLEAAKLLMRQAEESLNADLGWTVKVRVGWAHGRDWYAAH